jgi:hypothetical protein
MSKTTVSRLFIVAMVAVVSGWVIAIAAAVTALAGGAVVIGGDDVVTVNGGPFASALPALAIASALIVGGTLAALMSWLGALLNTARLEDKTWFVVLLVLGLWSFGFVAMFAYVFAGPDSTKPAAARSGMATTTGT